MDRFARDVLDEPRVRTVIVLDGTNDLLSISATEPHECGVPHPDLTAEDLIEGFCTLIRLARDRSIRIIGATVLPFKDDTYGLWNPKVEEVCDGVNDWIRTSGEFDAVIDFDRVMSNRPTRTRSVRSSTVATGSTPTTPASAPWPPPSI